MKREALKVLRAASEWIAASAHLPPIVDGIMQWKRVWPEEFYKYRFGVVDAEEESGRKQIESSGLL